MRCPGQRWCVCPGKGAQESPLGLRYLPTRFRPVPAPRSAEETVLHPYPAVLGLSGVPEPSRSHPGHGGSRRVPEALGQLCLGCARVPSGASPGLRLGRRRRAPPGLLTALQSRPSGSPEGSWSPGQRDCSQRGSAALEVWFSVAAGTQDECMRAGGVSVKDGRCWFSETSLLGTSPGWEGNEDMKYGNTLRGRMRNQSKLFCLIFP